MPRAPYVIVIAVTTYRSPIMPSVYQTWPLLLVALVTPMSQAVDSQISDIQAAEPNVTGGGGGDSPGSPTGSAPKD